VDSSTTLQIPADSSGCGFDVGQIRVFQLCDRGWNRDYDKIRVLYRARIGSEGDVRVIIRAGEFPDLARVHVEADRRQVAWRHASASGSPT